MPGERFFEHIRRCCSCGYKTHKRYWDGERCPICGEVAGYFTSLHGGLTEGEIEETKRKLEARKKQISVKDPPLRHSSFKKLTSNIS